MFFKNYNKRYLTQNRQIWQMLVTTYEPELVDLVTSVNAGSFSELKTQFSSFKETVRNGGFSLSETDLLALFHHLFKVRYYELLENADTLEDVTASLETSVNVFFGKESKSFVKGQLRVLPDRKLAKIGDHYAFIYSFGYLILLGRSIPEDDLQSWLTINLATLPADLALTK